MSSCTHLRIPVIKGVLHPLEASWHWQNLSFLCEVGVCQPTAAGLKPIQKNCCLPISAIPAAVGPPGSQHSASVRLRTLSHQRPEPSIQPLFQDGVPSFCNLLRALKSNTWCDIIFTIVTIKADEVSDFSAYHDVIFNYIGSLNPAWQKHNWLVQAVGPAFTVSN